MFRHAAILANKQFIYLIIYFCGLYTYILWKFYHELNRWISSLLQGLFHTLRNWIELLNAQYPFFFYKTAFYLNHLKQPLPSILPNISFKITVNCCLIWSLHDGRLAKALLTSSWNESLWYHKCCFSLRSNPFDRIFWTGLWILFSGAGSPVPCKREVCSL